MKENSPGKESPPVPATAPVPPPEHGKERTWTTRLGQACVLALGVAVFSSVPTALRTARAGGSFLEGLLVGVAVLLPLVAISLALFRAAGRGLRGIVGAGGASGAGGVRVAVLRIALWIGLSVPLLAILGTLLKATTNHRGLGGATFGVLALGAALGAALAAHRIVVTGQRLAARGVRPWILAAAGAAIGVLPLLVVASPIARAGVDGGTARAVQAALIDGAIALVATALVASVDLGPPFARIAGTWGVPFAAVLIIFALARVESSPSLGRAVRAGGGLAASLLGALEGWTDRDGDGMGAHFGGADCDEGDPARHPGVAEIPGDGVDQDCDGTDLPRAAAADQARADAKTAGPAAPSGGGSPAPDARADSLPAAHTATSAQAATAMHATTAAPDTAAPSTPAAIAPGSAATPPGPAAAPVAPGSKPDILLITLDTVRADHTSAYGYTRPTTPNLDALAARGVLFERTYAVGSDTQRALAPIIAGRRLSQLARDRREWPTLYTENDMIAERMKRAGYLTAAVTSFTWLSEERGVAQGFDRFQTVFLEAHPERDVTGELALQAALSILKELEGRAEPIFLWLHLFDAHEKHLDHPGISFGRGQAAKYDGEIAFVDKLLGALRQSVEKSPRAARTAFVVHGSHGEGLSEHDFTGHGSELYEEVLRVPLVIALPDGKPGRYDKGVVSTVDIAPTVLALAGAPSEGIEGESLLPIVRGQLDRPHGPVYARAARRAALIDWPLKLMVIERKKKDRLLLFDLAADPKETKDISVDRPDDLTKLIQKREAFEPPEK